MKLMLISVCCGLLVGWCRAAAISPKHGTVPDDATSIRRVRGRGPVLAYHDPLGFFRGISPDDLNDTSYKGSSNPARGHPSSYFSHGNIKPSIHGFGGGSFLGNHGFDGSTNDLDGSFGAPGGSFKRFHKSTANAPGFLGARRGSFGVPPGYHPSYNGFVRNRDKQFGLGK